MILHSDNHLLVVSKRACLPTVPDESGDESLLDLAKEWVRREFDKPGRVFLGVVHRLDRPVSGVVAFARTSKAARRLTGAFRERRVAKTYWGVTAKPPEPATGELSQWLAKDRSRNRVHVVEAGQEGAQEARTRWRVLGSTGTGADRRFLVELVPETGRPHQLRVAARTLRAPLVGDLKYGAPAALPDGSIALHAYKLVLPHPISGDPLSFESRPPETEPWAVVREAIREP